MGRLRISLVVLAFALVAAACGTDEPTGSGSSTSATGATAATGAADPSPTSYPLTVPGSSGDVTIAAMPERIVSLSPTATEMLFAIGAGDQVVAVDEFSTYPPEAPITDLSGFEPNVEAIAGYEPDLVVFATETGDLGSSLEGVGITALHLDAAATLDDAYGQLLTLGAATGHPAEAEGVVAEMRAEVDAILAEASGAEGLTYYYELDDTYYTVTSETFIGQLFASLGMENIADAAGDANNPYPQLSAEYIVESDPDLIFLADTVCCGQTPETVAERPGWDRIAAVQRGGVVPLDDDLASRWGPRVVGLLRTIADAAAEEAQAA